MLDVHMNVLHIWIMTSLYSYLDRHNVTQSEFAEKIGLSQSAVSKLASGAALPSMKIALAIDRATLGEVPLDSWSAANPTPASEASEGKV